MRPVPLVLAAATGAVSLGVAGLLYARFGSPDVSYGPRRYVVESDTRVLVEFEVAKDPAASAVCTVRARDATGAEAGIALVRVGPAPQRTVRVVRELTTTARAVVGEVTGCTLEQPAPVGRP